MLALLFIICYLLGSFLVWVSFRTIVGRKYPPKNTKMILKKGFSVSGWKAFCIAVFLFVSGFANFAYPLFYLNNYYSIRKEIREAELEYEKTKERIREIELYREENN